MRIAIVLICLLVERVYCQYRTCLYSDSSRTQLTNLQHQLRQNLYQNCIVCLPKCRSCLSSNDESCANGNCQSRYYYNQPMQICDRCEKMCEQCTSSGCVLCITGYYLDSNAKCKNCPNGVATCTSSSILQCLQGYYYDTQSYVCRKCSDQNCLNCFSKLQCNQCQSGYILKSDSTGCLSCNVDNCKKCATVGSCLSCSVGYQLISNSICSKYICSGISNCKQCNIDSVANITVCTLCDSGFYLLENSCHFGSSMMCSYSLTLGWINQQGYTLSTANNLLVDYGSCSSCNEDISQLADNTFTFCIPKMIGVQQQTDTNFYVFNEYILCSMPYLDVTQPGQIFEFIRTIAPCYEIVFQFTAIALETTLQMSQLPNLSNILIFEFNINSSIVEQNISAHRLFCSSSGLNLNPIIFKQYLRVKIISDYPLSTNINASSTIQQLRMNMSINKTKPGLQFSKLSMKQLYLTQSLCMVTNCLQCMSTQSCTKCFYPYLIQNFQCVWACDIGYYLNAITRKCLSQCQFGYFADPNLEYNCLSCPSQCVSCKSSIVCTKCSEGFYLTVSGLCLDKCQNSSSLSNYYPYKPERICKKCQNPCNTCSQLAKNCTSCLIGFQYYNYSSGICVFDCPIGYFSKVIVQSDGLINPKCLPCQKTCKGCYIQNNFCISCYDGYFLYQSSCVDKCPNGYFSTLQLSSFGQNGICKACKSPCSKCFGIQNNCTQCKFSLFLLKSSTNQGQCVSKCPSSNYYTDHITFQCKLCTDSNCQKCQLFEQTTNSSQKQICRLCKNQFVLQNYVCKLNCSNAWPTEGVCQNCPYPCAKCFGTGPTNFTCNRCLDSHYLMENGKCSLVCPIGAYGNWSNYQCVRCPEQCKRCRFPVNSSIVECTQCNQNYTLSNYKCIALSIGCPSSSYLSSSSLGLKCQQCLPICLQCANSQSQCTKCPIGKYLLNVSSECVIQCPHGFYPLSNYLNELFCNKCQGLCIDCWGTSQNCSNCLVGGYLYYQNGAYKCLTNSQCSKVTGYFPSSITNQCLPCIPPCLLCESQLVCSKCDNNSYLFRNSCIGQCSIGYYPHNNECISCPESCISCTSGNECDRCQPGYFHKDQSCLVNCQDGDFGNLATMVCEECKYPCLLCKNSQYCLSCDPLSAKFIFNGQCVSSCPNSYYLNTYNNSKQCLPCDISCELCSSTSICTSCSFGYYFFQQNCLKKQNCPAKHYADLNTRKCSPCQLPCITCSSKYECLSCITGFSLKDSSCYLSCPIGSYSNNENTCEKCPINCSRCSSRKNCIDCSNGTYLYTNNTNNESTCVANCPNGTFLQLIQSACQICSSSCKTCQIRSNNCTSCFASRKLQNNECKQNCSKFYYELVKFGSSYCQKCNMSCLKCLNFQLCQICVSSYLVTTNETKLYQGQIRYKSYCSQQCPPATFKDSEKFICSRCQQGCLKCTNEANCFSCSQTEGYILYNIHCLSSSCPENLYTIKSQNRCVEESFCKSNTNTYMVYEKQKQCFKKDEGGCPPYLVMRNQNQCIQTCDQGYIANFQRLCIKSTVSSQNLEFGVYPIPNNGYIKLIINFNAEMNQQWIKFFSNVTVIEGVDWKKSKQLSKSRLLTQQLSFRIQPSNQVYKNSLALSLIPQQAIQIPTDLTIMVSVSQPYSQSIDLGGYPLQNWNFVTTLSSYMATEQQIEHFTNKGQAIRAIPILLILVAAVISCVNLLKSGKIYLLIPVWDFMHFLFFLNYLNVYWPLPFRLFMSTFSSTLIRFNLANFIDVIIFSPSKVHANATDMNLIRNLLSNIIIVGLLIAVLLICKLIKFILLKRKNKQQKQKERQLNSGQLSEKYGKLDRIEQKLKKLTVGIVYLCLPNIFFFSVLNVSYSHQNSLFRNVSVVSIIFSCLILLVIGLVLVKILLSQMKKKIYLDSGINMMKKQIIICLPFYLICRKLLIILFLAVLNHNAAFPLCFGFITTAFIFILICWFEPYNNIARYRATLINEGALFLFFLFNFIYVCNERQMMQGGYAGFLMFIAISIIIIALFYPFYHIYCLTNAKYLIYKLLKINQHHQQSKEGQDELGCCIQQSKQYPNDLQPSMKQSQNNNQIVICEKDARNKEQSSSQNCTCSDKNQTNQNGVNQSNHPTQNLTKDQKIKRRRKIRTPQKKLIEGQTDYEADNSSQQGQKNKMKLADYTVRLAKRQGPVVKKFKNYEFDEKSDENDEDLAEKQIQLSKLIQKQKTLFKPKKDENYDNGNMLQ